MKSDSFIVLFAIVALGGTISWCSYDSYNRHLQLKQENQVRHQKDVEEFKQNNNLVKVSGQVFQFNGIKMIPVSFVKTKYRICVPIGDKNPKDGEIWEIKLNGTSYDNSSYEFVKLMELKNET